MKLSSTEAAQVRPAAYPGRQLRGGMLDARYSSPALEADLRETTAKALADARAQGYAAGWAEGRRAAGEREAAETLERATADTLHRHSLESRTSSLMQSLADAGMSAAAARVPEWDEVSDTLTEGALAIARAALGRELTTVDSAIAEAVRCAVRTLGYPSDLVLHVHPDDVRLLPVTTGLRIEADPDVPAGSVAARTPAQQLRVDLPTALVAAEEVLRS